MAAKIPESRQRSVPLVDPGIRLRHYAAGWLQQVSATTKPRTVASYSPSLRLYILPAIGNKPVRPVQRGQIKCLLAEKLASGLS